MLMQVISRQEVDALVDAYPEYPWRATAVMQDMQRQYGYIPRDGLEALAERLGRPLSSLYAIATFYKALSLTPRGKHIIKVCDGTACHIRGSVNILDGIRHSLGIGPGGTTADGAFSLELVNCVGACALAPVMVVDGVYYGKVTQDALPGIFSAIREGVTP
jgi:NADH-quinone oxidoreductase subunit E